MTFGKTTNTKNLISNQWNAVNTPDSWCTVQESVRWGFCFNPFVCEGDLVCVHVWDWCAACSSVSMRVLVCGNDSLRLFKEECKYTQTNPPHLSLPVSNLTSSHLALQKITTTSTTWITLKTGSAHVRQKTGLEPKPVSLSDTVANRERYFIPFFFLSGTAKSVKYTVKWQMDMSMLRGS